MATIERRSKGWRARVRRQGIGTVDRRFLTKAEAVAWASQFEGRYLNNEFRTAVPEQLGLTLHAALLRYEKEVTPLKRGAPQERQRIAAWLRQPLSRERLCDLTSRQLATYRDLRLNGGTSANTVRLELALISHLFTIARREWGMEFLQNPISIIRKPSATPGRDRRLIGDEESKLLDGARASGTPWLEPIIIVAIETAMRQGEILGLRWEDVDLQRRIAHLKQTKNGEQRRVPLSRRAIEAIAQLPPRSTGPVFPYTGDRVRLAFYRLRALVEMKDFHFHDLRHEATSRLFEKGFNQMEVATITGHKTLQMLKRYTHLRAEDLVARLDRS